MINNRLQPYRQDFGTAPLSDGRQSDASNLTLESEIFLTLYSARGPAPVTMRRGASVATGGGGGQRAEPPHLLSQPWHRAVALQRRPLRAGQHEHKGSHPAAGAARRASTPRLGRRVARRAASAVAAERRKRRWLPADKFMQRNEQRT